MMLSFLVAVSNSAYADFLRLDFYERHTMNEMKNILDYEGLTFLFLIV